MVDPLNPGNSGLPQPTSSPEPTNTIQQMLLNPKTEEIVHAGSDPTAIELLRFISIACYGDDPADLKTNPELQRNLADRIIPFSQGNKKTGVHTNFVKGNDNETIQMFELKTPNGPVYGTMVNISATFRDRNDDPITISFQQKLYTNVPVPDKSNPQRLDDAQHHALFAAKAYLQANVKNIFNASSERENQLQRVIRDTVANVTVERNKDGEITSAQVDGADGITYGKQAGKKGYIIDYRRETQWMTKLENVISAIGNQVPHKEVETDAANKTRHQRIEIVEEREPKEGVPINVPVDHYLYRQSDPSRASDKPFENFSQAQPRVIEEGDDPDRKKREEIEKKQREEEARHPQPYVLSQGKQVPSPDPANKDAGPQKAESDSQSWGPPGDGVSRSTATSNKGGEEPNQITVRQGDNITNKVVNQGDININSGEGQGVTEGQIFGQPSPQSRSGVPSKGDGEESGQPGKQPVEEKKAEFFEAKTPDNEMGSSALIYEQTFTGPGADGKEATPKALGEMEEKVERRELEREDTQTEPEVLNEEAAGTGPEGKELEGRTSTTKPPTELRTSKAKKAKAGTNPQEAERLRVGSGSADRQEMDNAMNRLNDLLGQLVGLTKETPPKEELKVKAQATKPATSNDKVFRSLLEYAGSLQKGLKEMTDGLGSSPSTEPGDPKTEQK